MLPARGHGRHLLGLSRCCSLPSVTPTCAPTFAPIRGQCAPWARRSLSTTRPRWAAKTLDKTQLETSTPVAEQLAATGIWKPRHVRSTDDDAEEKPAPKPRSRGKKVKGDKARVNIVSDKLCDDVLAYLGPSLKRHHGCDIIDVYPGAGVWSQKLHDILQPRSHILMEPDEQLYQPFLEPFLKKPGVRLVPKSGIVWRDVNTVLTPEYLPHQTPIEDPFQPSPRNDTLLVTANIAFHPKKKYRAFESIAMLVFHQLLDSIRTSTLFQRYGQVRMLIWSRYDDKGGILPKMMQRHKRTAVESEMSCEYVREVCGRDGPDSVWFVRDTATEIHSTLCTIRRMRAARLRAPKHRETSGLQEARTMRGKLSEGPGKYPPIFKRPYADTLSELEAAHEDKVFEKSSAKYKSMKSYQWRQSAEDKRHEQIHEAMMEYDRLVALHKSGEMPADELKKLDEAWHESVHDRAKAFVQDLVTYKDNLHYVRQEPPLLFWDQRPYEPLKVEPEEFFPNIECSLLDIQPKDVHPLLRQTGPQSNRAADMMELVMGALLMHSTMPVDHLLDVVWPGATDYILPRWKSIRDLDHGGVPPIASKHAAITPRTLNARQWEELLELWMEWPFRPELHELIGRTQDTEDPGVSEEFLLAAAGMGPGGG